MKYFVVSDVHSFYTPLKTALDNAGFDPKNENYTLISCGDLFDRGDESEQVLDYIMSLPRKILVRGNHESMLMELVFRKRTAEACDQHNGTIKTIFDLGGALKKGFTDDYQNRNGNYPESDEPDTINIYNSNLNNASIELSFKNTSESSAKRWLYKFLRSKGFNLDEDDIHTYQDGEYHNDWVIASCKLNKLSK